MQQFYEIIFIERKTIVKLVQAGLSKTHEFLGY